MSRHHVVHLTTVHPRYDTRIFSKMCRGLVASGYACTLIVADGKGDEVQAGVRIIDIGAPKDRWSRMLWAPRKMRDIALGETADIYHLHDPELLTVASGLRRTGAAVVFDAHEDLPIQVLEKSYIPQSARYSVSVITRVAEQMLVRNVDAIVGATPWIADKFANYGSKSVWVANFADAQLQGPGSAYSERPRRVSYVGAITRRRGIVEVIRALSECDSPITLGLAGQFQERNLRAEVELLPGWGQVDYLGYIPKRAVEIELSSSRAGLVTIHPTAIDLQGLPVKLFEYMAAGIPVVASNIPHWIEIVEGNGCGICVDPAVPGDIADALDYILRYPDEAAAMGERGRLAVEAKFHWRTEMQKLLALYDSLGKVN